MGSRERKMSRLADVIGKGQQLRQQRETMNVALHNTAARANPWVGGGQDANELVDLFVEVLAESVGCVRADPPRHWRLNPEHPLAGQAGMTDFTWNLKQGERMAVARLLRVLPILCKDLRVAAEANPKRPFLLAYFAHVSPRTGPDESQDNYLKILPRDIVARAHHSLHDGLPHSAAHEILPCYTKSDPLVAPPAGEFGTWRDGDSGATQHTDPRDWAFCEMPQTAFPRLAPVYTENMTNHRKQQMTNRLAQLEALSTPSPGRVAKLKAELRLGPVDTRLLRQLPGMDSVFMPSFTATPVLPNDTDEDFAIIRGPAHADPTVTLQHVLMDRYHTVNQLEYNSDAEATDYYARFEATKDVPQSLPPEVKRFVGRLRYVYYRALLQNFWTARSGVGQRLLDLGLHSVPNPPPDALHGRWGLRDLTDYALPPRIDFTGHDIAGPPGLVARAVFATQNRDQDAIARNFMSEWQNAMHANAPTAWNAATGLPENHSSGWTPPSWLQSVPSALDGRIGLGFDPEQAKTSVFGTLDTTDCCCTHCPRTAPQNKGLRMESVAYGKSFVCVPGQPVPRARFAPLTAQTTGSALAKSEGLDDFLHALFYNVQSTDGPAGGDAPPDAAVAPLDRAARAPLVKQAKKLFENGMTDEELAKLGADPNADVGKAARLLKAQMDVEEELAQLEAAQRDAYGGAADEGPPDTTEMRAKRLLIAALKQLRILVSGGVDLDADGAGADGAATATAARSGPICAATNIPIETAHVAALLPCCLVWQDSRTLPQHSGTAPCEHCGGTLNLNRIHSAQTALDAIHSAPALKAAREREAEAKRNAAKIARERRQRVLDASLGPDEQNVEGNRDWLLGRIKELRNANLVQPLDYTGALIRLVLHYKPNAKILLAYHIDFAIDKAFSSRDQQLDAINNRLADQIASRVPNLPRGNIAGLRNTGKMAEVSAYRTMQDQPGLLFCNMIKQCRGAFFGLDVKNTDVAIIENITGRLADQDRQQFVGRMMRCDKLPLGHDFVANPESPFPAKLLIYLRSKNIHGGGGEGSDTARAHVDVLTGKRTSHNPNPDHAEAYGIDASDDEAGEDQAALDEMELWDD